MTTLKILVINNLHIDICMIYNEIIPKIQAKNFYYV